MSKCSCNKHQHQCCDTCTGWAAYVKKHKHPPKDKTAATLAKEAEQLRKQAGTYTAKITLNEVGEIVMIDLRDAKRL